MKLEFISSRWKNFLSYGNKWQEIEFLPGINFVLGSNKETNHSNGSGKCVISSTLINIKCSEEIEKILSKL